MNLVQVVL